MDVSASERELELDVDDDDDAMLAKLIDDYHRTLLDDGSTLEQLERLGVTLETVRHFRVGLGNRTLGPRLRRHRHGVQMQLRRRLQELGVLRSSGHEALNGCVVVPIVDSEGRVVQLYGYKIRERRLGRRDVWIHPDRRGVFGARVLDTEVVVTASIVDALVLWSSGQRSVMAVNGLDGPLEELCVALRGARAKRVVVAFPNMPDGDAGADRLAAALVEVGCEVQRVVFPKGTGCSELVGSSPEPSDAFTRLLEAAQPVEVTAPALPVAEVDAREPERHIEAATAEPRAEASSAAEHPDELRYRFGSRTWRIRGLETNRARGTLRVNVLVAREGGGFHVDVLDLAAARQRMTFARMAADELRVPETVVKSDLGQVLLGLEQAQDELLLRVEAPVAKAPVMTEAQKEAALELLRDPTMLDRILGDLEQLGVVGEQTNLLAAYLAAVSRKVADPLAVVVQSSSAAGKSSLVQAVLSLVPEEDRVVYSAMTGQSLYYMGSIDLRHKVLSIAEDRGIARASYALKLLQSEGGLTIASTGKDAGTGRLVSQEYRVEGPVSVMLTTTDVDLDEELLSRCLVLTVDESPAQTRRIHEHQRKAQTLEGLRGLACRDEIVRKHHDAQRLLRSVRVLNPFVDELAFADLRVRARRDHRKLLGLIEVIAMMHQYQRPMRTIEASGRTIEVVEAVRSDVELARRLLAAATPGLDDLPHRTRAVLDQIDAYVGEQAARLAIHRDHVRFSRRQLREHGGVSDSQLKVHLRRLVDAELVVRRCAHGRVLYAMAFDMTSGGDRPGVGRGSAGGRPGGGRGVAGFETGAESEVVSSSWLDSSAANRRIGTPRTPSRAATYDVLRDREGE